MVVGAIVVANEHLAVVDEVTMVGSVVVVVVVGNVVVVVGGGVVAVVVVTSCIRSWNRGCC